MTDKIVIKIKESIKIGDYVEIYIGTDKDPKLIKIGKDTSKNERNSLINLIKEYRDVLAFSYDELKLIEKMCFNTLFPSQKKPKRSNISDKNLGE